MICYFRFPRAVSTPTRAQAATPIAASRTWRPGPGPSSFAPGCGAAEGSGAGGVGVGIGVGVGAGEGEGVGTGSGVGAGLGAGSGVRLGMTMAILPPRLPPWSLGRLSSLGSRIGSEAQ